MFSLLLSAKHVRAWVRNLKIHVQKRALRCQLVDRTSKSEGVKCDVLKFPWMPGTAGTRANTMDTKKSFECSKSIRNYEKK